MRYLIIGLSILLISLASACKTERQPDQHIKPATNSEIKPATGSVKPKELELKFLKDAWANIDDYQLIRIGDNFSEMTNYAYLLQQQQITKAKFGTLIYPLGTTLEYSQANLLSERKQLIVRQEIPKTIAYWIADLQPEYRLLFSSEKYQIYSEPQIIDLDNDGSFELIMPLTRFNYFTDLSNAASPYVEVIFKYDQKRREFIPANDKFAQYLLKDPIQPKSISPKDREAYLSQALTITLKYLYVGQEQEGWRQFQQLYQHQDHKKIKAMIKINLADCPIYQRLTTKNTKPKNFKIS